MRKLIGVVGALGILAGCGGKFTYSQVPPTTWQIAYVWTLPTPTSSWLGCGAGQPACSYVISILAVPITTTTCPSPSSTVVYAPVNQAAPTANLSYTYLSAQPASAICAVVQTVQSGSYSMPSAPSNVVDVPSVPGAPSTPGGTLAVQTADLETPTKGIGIATGLRTTFVGGQ